MRRATPFLLLALAACAAPAPRDVREAGCFVIEDATPPPGGLIVPRQQICTPVATSLDVQD